MSPNTTWTKCSDCLPECLHVVLVTDERDPSTIGFAQVREDGTWKLFGGDHEFMHPEQVTHWQPLPQPPSLEKRKVIPGHQNQVSDPDAPLHYYALTFTGTLANGSGMGSTFWGWAEPQVSIQRIDHASRSMGYGEDAILVACCYLGKMSPSQMRGESPLSSEPERQERIPTV